MQTAPRANPQRILQGSVTPVARGALRDQDGELTDGTGTVTATVYDLDGNVSGSPGRATSNVTTGRYTVQLTTDEAATLNVWRVDWLDDAVLRSTTWHRIVGGFLISRAELSGEQGVSGKYDDDMLDRAREWITNLIEHQTGAAWCPRYDVDRFRRARSSVHVTDYRPVRTLRSITVDDGTVVPVADVDLDPDVGTITGTTFYGLCAVGYEHGTDSPPETLREAALVAAADVLARGASGLSERTRSVTNDIGIVQQFSFPGIDHPTGIDFVDAAIRSHDQRLPSIA